MPLAEQLYLGMVLVAFFVFMIIVAVLAWTDGRLNQPEQAAPARNRRAPSPFGA